MKKLLLIMLILAGFWSIGSLAISETEDSTPQTDFPLDLPEKGFVNEQVVTPTDMITTVTGSLTGKDRITIKVNPQKKEAFLKIIEVMLDLYSEIRLTSNHIIVCSSGEIKEFPDGASKDCLPQVSEYVFELSAEFIEKLWEENVIHVNGD